MVYIHCSCSVNYLLVIKHNLHTKISKNNMLFSIKHLITEQHSVSESVAAIEIVYLKCYENINVMMKIILQCFVHKRAAIKADRKKKKKQRTKYRKGGNTD